MTITTILALVWLHFLADFVFQSSKMAINKSSSNYWLGLHVAAYTLVFAVAFGPVFAIVNGALHFATDYFTSRRTARQWKAEQIHDYFVTIGFDQAIHISCLAITWTMFKPSLFGWL